MALNYPPFAACVAMEQAARNAPPLKLGSRGLAVCLLQSSLSQVGEKLPLSTNKSGVPDGAFGQETKSAVTAFQTKCKIHPDGVAGSKTINALDAKMVAMMPVVPPPSHPQPEFPSTPHYEVGTGDPPLGHDPGAGAWKSKPWQVSYATLKGYIIEALPVAMVAIGVDASKHMAHYLGDSGRDYTIDLDGMVRDVPSARARYEDEVAQAQELVERLPVGRYMIHSKKAENGYNRQSESRNWFFAIGGYTKWGQGVAVVKDSTGGLEFELDFEYKFYDRYNWDAGKSVTFAGITVTDTFMGEFHRQGLAKEFNCYGSFKRHFNWKKGNPITTQQLYPAGGR
jgi:hypothetical protein